MSLDLEDRLRSTFATRAEDVPPAIDPLTRTTRAVARDRRRRASAGGALSLVAVAMVGVLAAGVLRDPAGDNFPERPARGPGAEAGQRALQKWPTRGNLADDPATAAAAVDAAARRFDVPDEDVQLLYVGRVQDRTLAIATTATGKKEAVRLVLEDRRGKRRFDHDLGHDMLPIGPQLGLVQVGRSGRDVRVLWLAAPGNDRLEMSRHPVFGADGAVERVFSSVPVSDDPQPLTVDVYGQHTLRFRSWASKKATWDGGPPTFASPVEAAPEVAALAAAAVSEFGDPAAERGVLTAIESAMSFVHLPVGTSARVLESRASGDRRATVVLLQTGDASFWAVSVIDGAATSAKVQPVGPGSIGAVLAVSADRPGVVAIAPEGSSYRVQRSGRRTLTGRFDGGLAVVPLPDDASVDVEIFDAAGQSVWHETVRSRALDVPRVVPSMRGGG